MKEVISTVGAARKSSIGRRSVVAVLGLSMAFMSACGEAGPTSERVEASAPTHSTGNRPIDTDVSMPDMTKNPYFCLVRQPAELAEVESDKQQTALELVESVVLDGLEAQTGVKYPADDMLSEACVVGVVNFMKTQGGIEIGQVLEPGDQIELPHDVSFEIAIQ